MVADTDRQISVGQQLEHMTALFAHCHHFASTVVLDQ